MEVDTGCINPVIDLIAIGQYAVADREQLLSLTLWLAPSKRSGRQEDIALVPADGPLTWSPVRAPVLLSADKVEFDESCLEVAVRVHCTFKTTTKDSLTVKL
jgi:hypothetical protein